MFEPFLDKAGPLAAALLLAVLFGAVLLPVLWDLGGRLAPEVSKPEQWHALARARLHAVVVLLRERVARAMLGSFVAGA